MSFYVVIPARYGSSRLPGKPLINLAGKPMVQHVYERAVKSGAAWVGVATDDARIANAVKDFGGEVVMTRASHESGTDRLQEVVAQLGLDSNAIVVNVQGDEPLIPAAAINQVAENLASNPDASVATLCEPIANAEDVFNPNIVKVVRNQQHMALYFSRAPVPWNREEFILDTKPNNLAANSLLHLRHIGLYAYRASLLEQFVTWPVGVLEQTEKLEQLRVMENGHQIHVANSIEPFEGGIDTQEDIPRVLEKLHTV